MTGWLRLERFHVVSERLRAAGVFTGELLDPEGTTIAVGSRRRTAPAEITRSLHEMAVVIGPVDVDLLGLTVSIPAFTMDTGLVRRPLQTDARLRVDVGACPARSPRGAQVCFRWPRGNPCAGVNPPDLSGNPLVPDACVCPTWGTPNHQQKGTLMSATDKIKNVAQDMKGKVEETAGKVSGNERLEAEGKADQAEANIKEAGENVKDALKD